MDEEQREDGELLEACYQCGYLIVCQKGVQCSECGLVYGTNDVVVARRRRDLIDGYKSSVTKAMLLWLGILIVYVVGGLGAMWVFDDQMPWVVAFEMVLGLIGFVIGSIIVGWIVSRFGPEHHRRVLWLIWLKALPAIHMSWLSVGGFTVVGMVIASVGRILSSSIQTGKDYSGVEFVLGVYILLSFLLWAIGSIAAIPIWSAKLSEQNSEYGVKGVQPANGLAGLVATLTWLVGCVFGFAGGVLGTFAIGSISGF